jgi:hypothetical protein
MRIRPRYAPVASRSRLAVAVPRPTIDGMDRATASTQIRDHCNAASIAVMKIHPLLNALGDEPTKSEIVKALFEITKNVEVVKKQVMRLEKRDDSALL